MNWQQNIFKLEILWGCLILLGCATQRLRNIIQCLPVTWSYLIYSRSRSYLIYSRSIVCEHGCISARLTSDNKTGHQTLSLIYMLTLLSLSYRYKWIYPSQIWWLWLYCHFILKSSFTNPRLVWLSSSQIGMIVIIPDWYDCHHPRLVWLSLSSPSSSSFIKQGSFLSNHQKDNSYFSPQHAVCRIHDLDLHFVAVIVTFST